MVRINITKSIFILMILLGYTSCGTKIKKEDKKEEKKCKVDIVSDNGAWCWFSDPRAIYYSDNEIITGWVKNDGSVEVASLNLTTQKSETKIIYPQLEFDDHDNPAFTVLPDGNILTMFAWHSSKNGIIYNQTTSKGNIHSFKENVVYKPATEKLLKQFPRETYTYANPYVLKQENNKLFAFGRWIGFKPNMIISNDNGITWDEQYVIVSNEPFDPNNRPYAKYYSDGKSKIHMIFTDGHPRIEPENSVYYCYYEKGAFWKANGEKICNITDLPFTTKDASVIYRPKENTGRAWISDIAATTDTPVVLYSRHPEEDDHRYHYARYNTQKKNWDDYEICKAGKWFPQTPKGEIEREPHYMGNMTLNPENPDIVYLSKEVNGIFEIIKYHTNNDGSTWAITPITKNSDYDNVRPYVPRYKSPDAKTVVLWMENHKYVHYTNFNTSIKYYIDN